MNTEKRIRYLQRQLESVADPDAKAKLEKILVGLVPEPTRTHAPDGKFKADDPSTKDINEAWKSGVSSKKRRKTSESSKRKK